MQARHTILTLDMTFKEPLVIKEGFCQCKMGFDCTAITQSIKCAWDCAVCSDCEQNGKCVYIKEASLSRLHSKSIFAFP